MSMSSNRLRPVGMLEKLYPARQMLSVYHSVIVTATYETPSKLEDDFLCTTLRAALPALLRRHPPLCCYVEGGETATPWFARLDTVEVRYILQFENLERGRNLAEKLQDLHDQPWPMGPKALWKLVVIRELLTNSDTKVDSAFHIALVFHHVIGDGLSGIAFHQSLLHELESMDQKNQEPQQMPDIIRTPTFTILIEPIEKLIVLPLSWMFLTKQVVKEYAPQWLIGAPSTVWAGLPHNTLHELPFHSRVRLVSIRAEDLQFLVEASRGHDVSLTSLLTASIASVLANELPSASAFQGLTPYTLRRVTGTSKAEMVNQSTGFETAYAADTLDRIRKASDITERLDSLWATAKYTHTQMRRELDKCPKDNLVGLLPYVINHVDYYKKKFGKAREATWELSNLGAFKASPGSSSKTWYLHSMIFTQGAQPLGSAFTVDCVSVQGKSLTLAITWQDRVVEEDLVDAVAQGFMDLPRLLQRKY